MCSFSYRGVKSGWLYGLSGVAVFALALPAFAQGLGTGSTGGGGSGSSGFGLSGSTGGGSSGGSGSFGLSGSGSSGTLGMSSSSGTGFGTGTTSSPFGSGTGSAFGGSGTGSSTGQYGAGRGGSNQPFFPTAATSNMFGKYYMNPLTPGTLNVSRTATFGQPIYATVTTTNSSGGARGGAGAGGSGSAGGYMMNTQSPRYGIAMEQPTAPLGRPPERLSVSPRAQVEVQGVLARSTSISGNRNINVVVDNGMLVLRGKVPSERDRQMAEGLALLTPGVNTLRNELQVSP